jgi:hypothetical protein
MRSPGLERNQSQDILPSTTALLDPRLAVSASTPSRTEKKQARSRLPLTRRKWLNLPDRVTIAVASNCANASVGASKREWLHLTQTGQKSISG